MQLTLTKLGLYELKPAPEKLSNKWNHRPGRAVTSDWHAAYAYRGCADADTGAKLDNLYAREQKAMASSWAMEADFDVPMPPGESLRPYQKAGVKYAMERDNTLIADVPRLGKSAQAIGVFNAMRGQTMIIVGPSLSKPQWKRYCQRWIAALGNRDVQIVQGLSDTLTSHILILNWEILDAYKEQFKTRYFDLRVLDECRAMKNEKSNRTKAALAIHAKKTVFLDGTPINTRPFDLWTVIRECDRWGLGANKFDFAKRYCDAERIPGEWNPDGASNLEELQRRMRAKFMIRREKKDVESEIKSSRQMVWLPNEGIENLIAVERALVVGADTRSLQEILEERVDKQTEESPALASARQALAEAKLPHVYEYVDRLLTSTDKVVIFAYHRAITTALAHHYPNSAMVIGGLTPKQRQSAIHRFENDPECRVFVGNIGACNSAISLAAADDVVYAELSWIPTEMQQSEERPWLPGKTAPITAHWIMFEDSVDAAMCTVVQGRMTDIGQALNREAIGA